MNKSANIFLFLFFIPTLVLSILIGFDATIPLLNTSGENIANREIYFLILGFCILIINARRSIKRWIILRMINKTTNYKWSSVVGSQRVKRVYTYNLLECLLMTVAGISLIQITFQAWLPTIGYLIGALDSLVFVIFGSTTKKFRIAIADKAILAIDREIILIYFNGLRKISFQQQTLFFDFKEKELQFRIPINYIPENERTNFFNVLKSSVDRKKVYFADNLPA